MANAKETSSATASAHSEGPWQERYDASTPSVVDAKGSMLCHVYPTSERSVGRANARLIAAAPDLLEACKRALSRLEILRVEQKVTVEAEQALLRAAVARAADTSVPLCKKCGKWPLAHDSPAKFCDRCEKTRLDEIADVSDHHERHPDECCCGTYLGRECCMAPEHGDVYRALCVENGERFTTEFRAKDLAEAKELGQDHAAGWGGECISVRKVRETTSRDQAA